jgi:hypothetical protein
VLKGHFSFSDSIVTAPLPSKTSTATGAEPQTQPCVKIWRKHVGVGKLVRKGRTLESCYVVSNTCHVLAAMAGQVLARRSWVPRVKRRAVEDACNFCRTADHAAAGGRMANAGSVDAGGGPPIDAAPIDAAIPLWAAGLCSPICDGLE